MVNSVKELEKLLKKSKKSKAEQALADELTIELLRSLVGDTIAAKCAVRLNDIRNGRKPIAFHEMTVVIKE